MIIYLVIEETSKYEKRLKWLSKAFTSKELATQFMNECNDFDEKWKQNSPNPAFYCDDTGTSYQVFEIELVTDKFMEELLTIKD